MTAKPLQARGCVLGCTPRPCITIYGRPTGSSESCRPSRRLQSHVLGFNIHQQPRQAKMQAASTLAPPASNPSSPDGVTYSLTIIFQGARDPDDIHLYLKIVSEDDPANIEPQNSTDGFHLGDGKLQEYKRGDPTAAGTVLKKEIILPSDFKPGALLVTNTRKDDDGPPFVATIELEPRGLGKAIMYAAYTYLDVNQGERILFPSSRAYPGFPGGTPKGLEALREQELKALRGSHADQGTERQGVERIYDYDVYNDLGDDSKPDMDRPVLGGAALKYPRRLRTGRKVNAKGNEVPPSAQEKLPWIPIDEHFNSVKNMAFNGGQNDSTGKAIRSVLGTPRGISFALSLIPFISKMHENNVNENDPRSLFTNLTLIDALYDDLVENGHEEKIFKDLTPLTQLSHLQALKLLKSAWGNMDKGLKKALCLHEDGDKVDSGFNKKIADYESEARKAAPQKNGIGSFFGVASHSKEPANDSAKAGAESLGQKVGDAVDLVQGLLNKWPVPRTRDGRALEWRTDEEFGRSALAGQNPMSIRAATSDDLKSFAVRDNNVAGLLEGRSLKGALEEGRLWVIDYHAGYIDYIKKAYKDKESVLYAGRCVFYTRNDQATVPVSIELETVDQPLRVYTPAGSAEVWLLAKTVFSSLDSGIHQLISHWLTTHACVEPYIIATRRHLSAMNPVYKLLQPHFRYTMRINCNARTSLVSAKGIVEQCFTPGRYCMELSSVVYGASWQFENQALPNDLLNRGVAARGRDGKLHVKLPNYPFAEDGLLLWSAIETFVNDYLHLYYDDNKRGHRVTDDDEITAWWQSVREEGHPDITEGWPDIKDVSSLRDILASIMWTASCHHAAVNFGQYDNAGYMPYKPTKIRAKIPDAGSKEEKALKNRFERTLMDSISDPISTLSIMVTIKILSAHAADEEYLDREEHSYIKEESAGKVHKAFLANLKAAEVEIEKRNQSKERLQGGRGLPYTLLLPSNPHPEPSLGSLPPARGIPFSISI